MHICRRGLAVVLAFALCVASIPGIVPTVYAEETVPEATEAEMQSVEETTDSTLPAQETTGPNGELTPPVGDAVESANETTAPTEATTAPMEEATAPTEETTAPTEETTAPTEETTAPTEATTAPVEETTAPTEETMAPTEETTAPTEASVLSADLQSSCGENLTWELDAEGTLTISGTGDMANYTAETETPWYADKDAVQKIIVSEGVTSIGDYAFSGFVALTDVSLPQSLTRIGTQSFNYCYMLESITIPKYVTELGDRAFNYCFGRRMIRVFFQGDLPDTPDGYPFFEKSMFQMSCNIFYDAANPTWTEEARQALDSSQTTRLIFIPCSNMSSTSGICGDGLTWSVDQDKKTLTISGSGTMDDWGEASAAPWNCFADLLELVVVEESVSNIGVNAFTYVNNASYQFRGTVPTGIEAFLEGKSSTVYYPVDDGDWQNLKTQYPNIKWTANGRVQELLDELMAVYETMTPAEIRAAVQSWDRDELLEMMYSGQHNIDLSDLELAVIPESVNAYITPDVPKLYSLYTDSISFSILGIGLNNLLDDSKMPSLTLDKTGSAVPVPAGYLSDSAVQFSIQLGNLENPENLAVPILISFSLPEDMNPFFQGLFWRNPQTGEVEEVQTSAYCHTLLGVRVSFIITGAGDYVFAQKVDDTDGGACGSNLTWTYDSSYTLTISGTGDMFDYNESDNHHPWYKYGESITRIVLEEGVTGIGAYAFGYNCRFADLITIPASVKRIGAGAFSQVNTTRLVFAGNAPEIAQDSFEGMDVTIYYPGDDESWSAVISNPQWGGADAITWMPLSHSGSCGENLTWSMDEGTGTLTISGTGEMDSYVFMDYPDPPWKAFYEEITKAVLEEGVTSIGDMAFGYCTNLQELVLPDSLTTIGAYALPMANFEELSIPAGVTSIDPLNGMSDDGMGDLQNVWVDENNMVYSSIDGVLFNKDQTMLVLYPSGRSETSYAVPEGTQMVGERAFWKNNSLRSVTLPSSLTKIGESAFMGTRLEEVVIPENVVSIGGAAFSTYYLLKKIIFEGDAPEIAQGCFDFVNATVYYPAGNDTWTEEVRQDYGGTLTWVSYEPGEPTQGMTQAEFLAALNAAIAAGEVEYQLEQPVVLTENVTLPEIMIRMRGSKTVLTVSDGVTLDGNGQYWDNNGAQIVVENKATLCNIDLEVRNGANLTVKPGGTLIADDQCRVVVWQESTLNVMDGANLQNSAGIYVFINDTAQPELPILEGVDKKDVCATAEVWRPNEENLGEYFSVGAQYGNFQLRLLDTCELKYDLEIPAGATLDTCGIVVPQGVTLTNNGTVLASMEDVTVDGTLINNGKLTYYGQRQLHFNGTFRGNPPELADVGTLSQEELESMIQGAVESGEWHLGISKQVTLTRDLEIPAGMMLEIVQGGGLTLTEGVTLTCAGEAAVYNCATIWVCSGAVLEIPGKVKLSLDSSFAVENGAVVKIQGSLTAKDVDLWIEDGSDIQVTGIFQVSGDMDAVIPLTLADTINGLLAECTTVTSQCATAEELAFALRTSQDYRRHLVTIMGEISLTGNASVPAICTIKMGKGATLKIPEGVTLTNLGTIELNKGSQLLVLGALDNQGQIVENGGIFSDGGESGFQMVEENLESLLTNAGSLSSEEIRKEVQAMDRDELAGAMEGENSVAAETIKKLESQLDVKTEVQSGIAEITGSQVSIVGAGLNNVIQEGTDIVLTIAAPSSDELDVPPEYDQKTMLAFSMTLENVENTGELAVPVKITLPVPAEMDPERLVLLHFHGGSQTPDVIIPEISEKDGNSYASFVLTGFSDFVMTHLTDEPEMTQPMYRLYNPYTLEHLFTSGEWEKDNLPNAGWLYEGVAWEAPTTGTPIYRLYNPYSDGHFYTASEAEIDTLLPLGWQMDGVVTYGADSSGTPIYRLFNPYETKNYHHYTTSQEEIDMLVPLGWILEGVAWYAA